MSWIKEVPYDAASGNLKRMYDRVKGPNNNVDNVLSVHSLRPHSLKGHMTLYKSVLHNSNNTLPKWYLESLGVYISFLNSCEYCVAHHFEGLKRLLNDDDRAEDFRTRVEQHDVSNFFGNHFDLGMKYAHQLTLDLQSVSEEDIKRLREAGFTDGEILEINQVTSYFNYVNRSVVGLGVSTEGDILGLSPNNSDEPDNWNHN